MTSVSAFIRKIVVKGFDISNGFPVSRFNQYHGVVLMLHRVRPKSLNPRLSPNESLEITPENLQLIIDFFKERKYEFVSLDNLAEKIKSGNFNSKFCAFTLDDGYSDNLEYAYPIFKQSNIPFTIYISNSFPNGNSFMWWYYLEELVLQKDTIALPGKSSVVNLECGSMSQKISAFRKLRRMILNELNSNDRPIFKALFEGIEFGILNKDLFKVLSWDDIKLLAKDPLVTIGAHTNNHLNISLLNEEQLKNEILNGAKELSSKISKEVKHFCVPFGTSEELGNREAEIIEKMNFSTVATCMGSVIDKETYLRLNKVFLPRMAISGSNSLKYLKRIHNGSYFFVNRLLPQ